MLFAEKFWGYTTDFVTIYPIVNCTLHPAECFLYIPNGLLSRNVHFTRPKRHTLLPLPPEHGPLDTELNSHGQLNSLGQQFSSTNFFQKTSIVVKCSHFKLFTKIIQISMSKSQSVTKPPYAKGKSNSKPSNQRIGEETRCSREHTVLVED